MDSLEGSGVKSNLENATKAPISKEKTDDCDNFVAANSPLVYKFPVHLVRDLQMRSIAKSHSRFIFPAHAGLFYGST